MAKKTQPPPPPEQRQRQREGVLRWQASRTPEEKHAAFLKAHAARGKARQALRQKAGKMRGRLAALNWTSYDENDR